MTTMVKECIIVGGGPAGTAAAYAAAGAHLESVLLIEREALGGTCTNRGCIPTKMLLSKAEAIHTSGAGARISEQWSGALGHKNALIRGLARSIEKGCRDKGIEIVKGGARFLSSHEIEVVGNNGECSVYTGRRIILATGSSPAELPGSPSDGQSVITSDQALILDPLPNSLAIIGSGAVGSEFARLFTRLGVQVVLIEAAQRLFPTEDPQVDALFREIYARQGVTIHTGDPVAGIERRKGSGIAVLLSSGTVVSAEKALIAIGRRLESHSLECQVAGIELDHRGGILVDDQLRTSQPHIFAAGDITGRMLLAHAAAAMGEFAAQKAFDRDTAPVPYHAIPWVTYTAPEVAAVGLSLEAAERSGRSCATHAVQLMDNVKARIDRTTEGFFKIVSDRDSGLILGGTIVGPHASDLIHVIALAIHQRMTRTDMKSFVFAHPTITESLKDLFA